MEKTPLVSIAVLCYNQEAFIEECINSCIMQLDFYRNIEIVVNDDFSSDSTREILSQLQERHPNLIRIILNEKNEGITKSSNNLLKHCKGKYIAWIGGDDRMLGGKIFEQVEIMENHPDCSLCYHNLRVFNSIDNSTIGFFNKTLRPSGSVELLMKYGCFNGACSTMTRSSSHPIGGFNESIPIASDWLFWIQTVGREGKIIYQDRILGEYRRHEENITSVGSFQVLIDKMVTCQILMVLYPDFLREIRIMYSSLVYKLRFFSNYRNFCIMSLRLKFRMNVLIKLLINVVSFNFIRL